MAEGAHILVVDDDSRLRDVLRRFLVQHGYTVTTAADAADADAKLAALSFDLGVLDVMMPGESGLDLLKRIRRTSRMPILLLTARGEPSDRIAGLAGGADDYLAKPFEPDELVLRIQAILRRAPPPAPPAPETVGFGPFRFALAREELTRDGQTVKLTTAEASLLRALAERAGEPVTRAALLQQVWGISFDPGTNMVDVHIRRLRRKVDAPFEVALIQTIRGSGYALGPAS